MTTTEALDILTAADPARTFSATKTAWHHKHMVGREREFTYAISAQPGYGEECTLIQGYDGLDNLVSQFFSKINPTPATPATPNNE